MGMMNYFVLFSLIIIATCAIVLLIPSQPIKNKGTNNKNKNNNKGTANKNNKDDDDDTDDDSPAPSAAGQRSLSSAAGAADGSSDHQHLLDTLLQKHDALVEGMQNDDDDDDNYGVKGQWRKWVGCNDKCVKSDAADAVGSGNCVHPPISDTNSKLDYSKRYCMAFAPPRGKPYMRDLECMTCGYYKYEAECIKTDPYNSDKCKRYGNYAYKAPPTGAESYYDCSGNKLVCDLFLKQRGGGGGGQGYDDDADGPVCSAATCKPKEVTIAGVTTPTQKCVIPGCMSNSRGLPYPNDFYGTDNINPCKLIGNGYICPAVTSGSTEAYNSGGSSGDPCYTTNNKVDKTKFQSMNQLPVCNSVRPTSTQNFKPGDFGNDDNNDDDNEDNDDDNEYNDDDDNGNNNQRNNNNNNNGSTINVYHHYVGSRIKWSSYKNPESGLMYLGIY